ncbi:MAG TPA: addiction module protein [Pirellulales bacterium]|nr:addiction module protein [Pirellulales bacterium]
MGDFISVLSAAKRLPEQDRLRLIEELWDSVPPEAESPFSDEWAREIQRRTAELDAGTAQTTPWSEVRRDALARLDHGTGN